MIRVICWLVLGYALVGIACASGSGAGPRADGAVKEKLTKDDLLDGVKTHAPSLGQCIAVAIAKHEIRTGRVPFIVEWTIKPDGSVTDGNLIGPFEVMNTSLPTCFSRVINTWTFPASKDGAPVKDVSIPITVQ